jgi:hypothetical protein
MIFRAYTLKKIRNNNSNMITIMSSRSNFKVTKNYRENGNNFLTMCHKSIWRPRNKANFRFVSKINNDGGSAVQAFNASISIWATASSSCPHRLDTLIAVRILGSFWCLLYLTVVSICLYLLVIFFHLASSAWPTTSFLVVIGVTLWPINTVNLRFSLISVFVSFVYSFFSLLS